MSSESMAPSNPKRAPEAPTEIEPCKNRADITDPPSPEIRYSSPILTARTGNF